MTVAIRKLPLSLTRLAASGLFGDHERALADRVEQRGDGFDRPGRAGRDHEQLAGRRGLGPAEHRRRDEQLAGIGVRMCQLRGQGDADGAARDVHRSRCQGVDDAAGQIVVTERDVVDGVVVGQHREHDVGPAARVGYRVGAPCALGDECIDPARRPVVGRDVVARRDEVGGHSAAHVPESDESDLHMSVLRDLPERCCSHHQDGDSQPGVNKLGLASRVQLAREVSRHC